MARVQFGGAVSILLFAMASSGCAGSLDPSEFPSTGSGGGGGGGSNGSGGSGANCTGDLAGATIVTMKCAVVGCHDAADANISGAGLDLTVNATVANRIVGVTPPGDTGAGSDCEGNTEPYLNPSSNPATGLLIDKLKADPPCGDRMPLVGGFLSSEQQTCLTQWATTLTAPPQ